jgi:hypothetical protein
MIQIHICFLGIVVLMGLKHVKMIILVRISRNGVFSAVLNKTIMRILTSLHTWQVTFSQFFLYTLFLEVMRCVFCILLKK